MTTTVAVPVTSNVTAPATIAVFAFVHAIIFKTPFMRVEVEALAPFASAKVVAVFARVAGAA